MASEIPSTDYKLEQAFKKYCHSRRGYLHDEHSFEAGWKYAIHEVCKPMINAILYQEEDRFYCGFCHMKPEEHDKDCPWPEIVLMASELKGK